MSASPREPPAWRGVVALRLALVAAACALAAAVCALAGASPADVAAHLWSGAFGTADRAARVMVTLAPLILCGSGLLFTFRAGLYNLGVEGQIVLGAVGATFATRVLSDLLPASLVVALGIAAGAALGALWGAVTGILHGRGRVSEIFAGLGMNFVAQGVVLYLIFGPWKRPGVASMAGTEPLAPSLALSTLGSTEASPTALLLAAAALLAAGVVLRRTHFGLRLLALGQNPRASEILGVRVARELFFSFALAGLFAGTAGALQVFGVFHRLIPNVSSGLGFLALLVVMLARFDARLVAPVALFFSALNVGSLQLPMTMKVESSLAGVLEGALVLFALLAPKAARGARSGERASGGRPVEEEEG